jgi:hypothetical protein
MNCRHPNVVSSGSGFLARKRAPGSREAARGTQHRHALLCPPTGGSAWSGHSADRAKAWADGRTERGAEGQRERAGRREWARHSRLRPRSRRRAWRDTASLSSSGYVRRSVTISC